MLMIMMNLDTFDDHSRIKKIISEDDAVTLMNDYLDKGLETNTQLKLHEMMPFGVVSILQMSIQSGALECTRLLLQRGADPDLGGRCGHVPLVFACKQPGEIGLAMIRALIEKGASVNRKYVNGNTALLEAVIQNDLKKVHEIIAAGANVREMNNGGDTALHLASIRGNSLIVETFLQMGIDPNIRQSMGPSIRTMRMLDQHHGSLREDNPSFRSYVRNVGISPLHFTSYGPYGGHVKVAELLVAAGADVNAKMENGRTPLHFCAMRNGYKVAEVLLKAGCQVDPVSEENEEHKTPLFKAIEGRHSEMVTILLSAGADINFSSSHGLSPLTTAIFQGAGDIAKVLIQEGADLEKACSNGITPLCAALRKNSPYFTKLLVVAGCTLPVYNEHGVYLLENVDIFDNCNYFIYKNKYKHEKEWLRSELVTVRSLRVCCRRAIRRCICKSDKLVDLPVPRSIVDFLCLKELDDIV